MSDRIFETFEQMAEYAKGDAKKILREKVAPFARKTLREHIQADIYDVYEPHEKAWVGETTYQRRGRLGSRVEAFYPEDDEVLVTSLEPANISVVKGCHFSNRYAGSFLELLASGNMGIWKNGFSRPAVELAQEDIETSYEFDRIVGNGIRKYMGEFDIV